MKIEENKADTNEGFYGWLNGLLDPLNQIIHKAPQ